MSLLLEYSESLAPTPRQVARKRPKQSAEALNPIRIIFITPNAQTIISHDASPSDHFLSNSARDKPDKPVPYFETTTMFDMARPWTAGAYICSTVVGLATKRPLVRARAR